MGKRSWPVAAEGIPFIAAGAALTAASAFLPWQGVALLPLVITLFIIYFFRNPQRITPADEAAVISPADGVVIYIGESFEEHLQAQMKKISIFMSVFNVHVNRAPVSGKVADSFYTAGKFLDVRHERATFENEQSGLVVETSRGIRLVVVQVAGLIARRIVCYPKVGDLMVRGERYGLIRFGSRLDVYLPQEAEVAVSLGQKTVAGETVLGRLP